jgi:hypothetical protein
VRGASGHDPQRADLDHGPVRGAEALTFYLTTLPEGKGGKQKLNQNMEGFGAQLCDVHCFR